MPIYVDLWQSRLLTKLRHFDHYCTLYVSNTFRNWQLNKRTMSKSSRALYSYSKLPGIVKTCDLWFILQVTRSRFLIQPQRGTPRPDPLVQDITHPLVNLPGGQTAPQAPPRGFLTPPAVPSTTTVGRIQKRTGGASTWGSVPTPPSTTPPPEAVNITRQWTVVKEKCHLILVRPLRNSYTGVFISKIFSLIDLDYSYIVW